jgi:hypothetical protein
VRGDGAPTPLPSLPALSPCYEHTRLGRRFAIGHCWASSPGTRYDPPVHYCRDRRLILITSLGIGGFPPAIALALLSAKDWTGELDALINLARLRGYYVRVAAEGVFEVEEKLTRLCHGTAAQVRRWLRENTGEETDSDYGHFRNGGAISNRRYFRQTDDDEGPRAQPPTPLGFIRMSAISTILPRFSSSRCSELPAHDCPCLQSPCLQSVPRSCQSAAGDPRT